MMWSVFLILVLLIPLTAVILDSRLGRALASRIEGGSPDHARMKALEAEVDRLSKEVELLQEQAEFVNRLLEERAGGAGSAETEPPAFPPDEAGG